MPTFIDYHYDQMKMLAVSYDKQILPGTFESSLMYLIDERPAHVHVEMRAR